MARSITGSAVDVSRAALTRPARAPATTAPQTTGQAQVGRLTAVVRAAALIVDIDILLHPRGRSGRFPFHCDRSPGSGSALASPSRVRHPVALRGLLPGHSGGTAPDSHRLPVRNG